MPGPTPKDPKIRQRRNKVSTARTFTDDSPSLIQGEGKSATYPELPQRKRKWRAETIAWWEDLWKSPMASEFIECDLHQLYLLADLMDEYWRVLPKDLAKKKELASEIRLQRQCFGLTPIDRRRLQWEIERGESASAKSERRRNAGKKSTDHKVDPRSILDSRN